MSPFRVVAKDDNGTYYILASMLSVNKKTGQRNVYIVEKIVLGGIIGEDGWDFESIAYRQCTRKNSAIVGRYRITLNDDLIRYTLSRVTRKSGLLDFVDPIKEDCRTQGNCLTVAMDDFIANNNLVISRLL